MPLLQLLFTGLSTGLSVVALYVAWRAVRIRSVPSRELHDFDLRLTEAEYQTSNLTQLLKRLSSRVGMREARAKKAELSETSLDTQPDPEADLPEAAPAPVVEHGGLTRRPDETADEWKARARRILHSRNL